VLALLLVLVAALTHASWNLLAKWAAASPHFVLLYALWAVALWLPVAVGVALVARPSTASRSADVRRSLVAPGTTSEPAPPGRADQPA
jgi:hypothetical protein